MLQEKVHFCGEVLSKINELVQTTRSIQFDRGIEVIKQPLQIQFDLEMHARLLDAYCELLITTTPDDHVGIVHEHLQRHAGEESHPLLQYMEGNQPHQYKINHAISSMAERLQAA